MASGCLRFFLKQNCFHIRVNIFIFVALLIIFDFYSLSIPLKVDLAFPSLDSTSCSVPPVISTTLARYVNSWTSSIEPFASVTACELCLHFHNFCLVFVNS